MATDKWYDDISMVRDLAEVLEECGVVSSAMDVVKKPYKFQPEYEIWAKFNFPGTDDEEYDDFVNALSEAGEE